MSLHEIVGYNGIVGRGLAPACCTANPALLVRICLPRVLFAVSAKKEPPAKDHSHKEVFKKAILSDTDKYKRINSCIINHKIAKPYAITTLLSIPLQITISHNIKPNALVSRHSVLILITFKKIRILLLIFVHEIFTS